MVAMNFDYRSKIVSIDYSNGREVPAAGIDPAIKYIDWDGAEGVVVYTGNERARRKQLVRDGSTDPTDIAIASHGQEDIDDIAPYQFLIDEWTAAAPPAPQPADPMRSLNTTEIEQFMIDEGITSANALAVWKTANR